MSASDMILYSDNTYASLIGQLRTAQTELLAQKNRLNRVCRNLDRASGSDVRISGGISLNCGVSIGAGKVKSVLSDYGRAFGSCADGISDLSGAIRSASDLFEQTEKSLISKINGLDLPGVWDGNMSVNTGSIVSELGSFISGIGKGVVDGFWSLIDNWKTGAAIVKGKFDQCVAAFAADWEAKGNLYRIVNAAGAVVNIVVGTATLVSAIAGTGVTAGLGAPATVLVGAYGLNTLITGAADLVNCITGNVDAVGEVNLLKSGLTMVGGQVGEWLGNRQIGESVGEVTYMVGGLATAFVSIKNLTGEIRQAHTAGNTFKESVTATKHVFSDAAEEISKSADDIGYLLTKCDVRNLKYEISLFTKQIPNVCKIVADAKLVQRGVSEATKLINAGIDATNTLAGWEMLQKPSLFSSAEQISKFLPISGETAGNIKQSAGDVIQIDKVKESLKDIGDVFALAFV